MAGLAGVWAQDRGDLGKLRSVTSARVQLPPASERSRNTVSIDVGDLAGALRSTMGSYTVKLMHDEEAVAELGRSERGRPTWNHRMIEGRLLLVAVPVRHFENMTGASSEVYRVKIFTSKGLIHEIRMVRGMIALLDPAAKFRQELIALINQYRKSQGNLPPLTADACLTKVAQAHTDWMAANNKSDHIGKDGKNPFQRCMEAGCNPTSKLAENLFYAAAGSATWDNPQGCLNYWKGSPGHNQNLLNPHAKIGIGYKIGFNKCFVTAVLD
jgi:uncharacterized protein YkwD